MTDIKLDWRILFSTVWIEEMMRFEPNGDIVLGGRITTIDGHGNQETVTQDNVRLTYER